MLSPTTSHGPALQMHSTHSGRSTDYLLQGVPHWLLFWRREDKKGRKLKHVMLLNAAELIEL
jgi:hypothetical protein